MGPTGEFFQPKSWFYNHASHINLSLAYCLSFSSIQMSTFPSLSLFALFSLNCICSQHHSVLLWLSSSLLALALLIVSLSLLGSILTPLNARALINQCRVVLFHRDPKQLVSSPVCFCLPVCCRCTSDCLCTLHACLHAVSFAERVSGKQDVTLRKGWMIVHGGFVSYRFACIQEHTFF